MIGEWGVAWVRNQKQYIIMACETGIHVVYVLLEIMPDTLISF